MEFNILLNKTSEFIWGGGLIFLLLFTGVIYTIKLRFVQFRFIPFLLSSSKNKGTKGKGISQLKTVCMSLGTAMGTGNITGVASAIAIGGAGAVFWLWVSAFMGMAIVYSENYLAAVYKRDNSCRGPIAYLEHGLGSRALAVIFAVCCVAAALGMGGMVQVSSFSDSLSSCFEINPYMLGAVILIVIFTIIKGGAQSIGSAAQALLPIVTAAYVIVSFMVIFKFKENIIPVFGDIFSEAFNFNSAVGGVTGFTISKAVSAGIRRGIFSNEAGLGSSPILHSASENESPQLQGMWSIFEVFFDTIICCTLTAIVILTSCRDGSFTVSGAFSSVLGSCSKYFLAIEMAIFAFCTVIGWYFCGETAFTYLSDGRHKKAFCLLYAVFASLGAVFTMETVWTLSDIFNGLMAIPNLLGLLLLINKVKRE